MPGIKLLIVDDETGTRDGLLRCISQMGNEFTSIVTAQDGYAALEMAENFIPDIMLCDIRMPRMDGLELASALLKKNEDLRIIFISGYADKEYLKTAVELKADSYIEKPIDIGELMQALERSIKLYKKRFKEKSEKEILSGIADIYYRNKIIKSLLCSQDSVDSLKTNIKGSFTGWPSNNDYRVYVFSLEWKEDLDNQYKDVIVQQLIGLIEKELSKKIYKNEDDEKILCGIYSNEFIFAVVPTSDTNWISIKPELEKFIMLLPSRLRYLFSVRITVSEKTNGIGSISEALKETYNTVMWMSFIESENKIVLTGNLNSDMEFDDLSSSLQQNLNRLNVFQAKRIIMKQTQKLAEKNNGSVKSVREYYNKLLRVCMESDIISKFYSENKGHILSAFSNLKSLRQISEFLLNRIEDMYPKTIIPSGVSSKSSAVVQYIWDNIDNPMLSISSISESLGLSKNYLNSMYKTETGKSIHKTIIEIRVECAMHLLQQDYKLYEVSQKVGFTDPTYFSTVFKKQTGISPTKFRAEKVYSTKEHIGEQNEDT